MAAEVLLLEVPFNAAGLRSGVARMPEVLVAAGLEDRLAAERLVARRTAGFPPLVPARGPSGLLAEDALVGMVRSVQAEVAGALQAGRFPLVIAGDCPALLGGLLGLGGRPGLVFVDGHEDAWDPWVTPSGEASDCELALALGYARGPSSLEADLPLVDPERVTLLGPRDRAELDAFGWPSLAGRVPLVDGRTLAEGDIATASAEQTRRVARASSRWWLHVDLDVLSTEALRAVDYPQPGGLTWEQLETLTAACLSVPGCAGASVAIYNPDLDGERAAFRINDYVVSLVDAALGPA